jgi:hypothetical protein
VIAEPSGSEANLERPASPSAGRLGRVALSAVQRRLFPFSAAAGQQRQSGSQDVIGITSAASPSCCTTLLTTRGIVIIAALLIWFDQLGVISREAETISPAQVAWPTLVAANADGLSADEAAIWNPAPLQRR